MRKKNLSRLLVNEEKLLRRSTELLRYRRINWNVETNHRIRRAFEQLMVEARTQHYPFQLYVSQFDPPNEGVIQVTPGKSLTGVSKRTVTHSSDLDELITYTPIIEEGGALVASQSISGHIAFIIHPRESERIKPQEKELFLYSQLDPTEVTDALIDKVIRTYLIYLRNTSLFGMHHTLSTKERIMMIYIKMADIRYKYKISRSLLSMNNEWAKLIMPILLGLIVGYFTGSAK